MGVHLTARSQWRYGAQRENQLEIVNRNQILEIDVHSTLVTFSFRNVCLKLETLSIFPRTPLTPEGGTAAQGIVPFTNWKL